MTTLVLTVVGADRAGIVAQLAEVIAEHGGNWERSELAELSGAFAGIVEVSVPDERSDALRAALGVLDGLLTIAVQTSHDGADAETPTATIDVLGNDHAGIVRDITAVLRESGLSIERMTTETREAAMFGGRLFEASVTARVPASVDLDEVTAALEKLAAELQVDVTLAG